MSSRERQQISQHAISGMRGGCRRGAPQGSRSRLHRWSCDTLRSVTTARRSSASGSERSRAIPVASHKLVPDGAMTEGRNQLPSDQTPSCCEPLLAHSRAVSRGNSIRMDARRVRQAAYKGVGCRVEDVRVRVELELGARRVRIRWMPTVARRPAAQAERDRLQARRLRAAELVTAGVDQAEVARQLEVSARL